MCLLYAELARLQHITAFAFTITVARDLILILDPVHIVWHPVKSNISVCNK